MWIEIYSVLVGIYWLLFTLYLLVNGNKIHALPSLKAVAGEPEPGIAVIIAVRNEEQALKEALTSVCNLNYRNYTIWVVNDRSTDGSEKILSELAEKFDRLNVINIQTLPAGWLGKNHALYTGSQASREEYMLFTDADVIFHKDVLKKAMGFCKKTTWIILLFCRMSIPLHRRWGALFLHSYLCSQHHKDPGRRK